jgi:DNA segregation ATPase FtsK/SpoIIIE-like protein
MSSILPFGNMIVGTFGIIIYPLSVVLAFLSFAAFLGFSYSRSVKSTVYCLVALFSFLFAIHSISTFKTLDAVATWKTMQDYLEISYLHSTLLGSFGSIFCGLISLALGGMGTIIVFVILTTIFVGLFIDYQFYGKYEQPHIKKLKSKKLREKVYSSDSQVSSDGSPNYSFTNSSTADEISVDAEAYENMTNSSSESQNSRYSESDVVDEITNENIDSSPYQSQTNYYSNGMGNYEEKQSQNQFSQNAFAEQKTYPDVYSPDMDDYRRQFMKATFGNSENLDAEKTNQNDSYGISMSDAETISSPINLGADDSDETDNSFQQETYGNNNFNSTTESDSTTYNNVGSDDYFNSNKIDDEISKILNTDEDDEESIVSNVNLPKTNFGFGNTFEQKPTEIKSNNDLQESEKVKRNDFDNIKNINNDFESRNQGFSDSGFGSGFASNLNQQNANTSRQYEQRPAREIGGESQNRRVPTPENAEFNKNFGAMNNFGDEQKPKTPPQRNIVVPAKETKPIQGINVGMTGVRYNPPPLSLLRQPKADNGDYTEEQNRKSAKLENVLEAFNIPAKVKNIIRGPKITRYELSVPLGVSVKKIPMFEDDIAAALAAKTIVIKAPIPGSSFVGIELENDTFSSVYERELLESDAFQNFKDPLPIAIGKDISGEIVVKSLAKMVHLLIAGSTGSGKSVFIHNIVLSLIYKSSPDDLRLIMIDPKKVEFNRYNGLPHLLTPEVVMGSDKAINALKWSVKEMERRYDLMSKAGYNNIEPYNKSELVKAGQFEKFPYIVIIVDELAEIMMVNKKEVEACIQRLTQLARACGMHLILATQRPSVDIISGVIKNNVPSRIAFSLQSGIDSKTILNATGAEKLLGQGDMIFAPTGTSSTPRLQAAYASDEEIKAVIDYDIKYNKANYDETVNNIINSEQQADTDASSNFNGGDGVPSRDSVDSYFKEAVRLVMQNGGASVSYLQRRLSIGYSRAARIIDQMEDKGYIAGATGSKVRKVLITPDQFYEEFGEAYDNID